MVIISCLPNSQPFFPRFLSFFFPAFAPVLLRWYFVGLCLLLFQLLYGDVITARSLLAKTLKGSALTRRERKQLLRTVSDLFRLVPFSMFVLIPLMEFALPLALKLFPNLLPSTYQESLKVEESMKKELQSRIAMAQFFQE